jgi:hemerythrin
MEYGWRDAHATGHPNLDSQHHLLFELVEAIMRLD